MHCIHRIAIKRRALVLRCISNTLTQDNALNELRQELGNLRLASAAAAAAAEAAPALKKQSRASTDASQTFLGRGSMADGSGTREGVDMTRTFSMSSGDSFEQDAGLGAIAEEEDDESESSSLEGDKEDKQEEVEVEVVSSESESETEEGERDESGSEVSDGAREGSSDAEGADEDPAATQGTPAALTLDEGHYAKDAEAAEAFAAAKFAAADGELEAETRRSTDRLFGVPARLSLSPASYSLSPGPRAAAKARASVAPASRSLSPVRRGGVRASWSPGARPLMNAPSSNCLSPMVRLAPADHGMGEVDNTVVLELGAWRVRAGVVEGEGGSGGRGGARRSYFDDFPCCVARPRREGADLDELVNGASSLAAPMYSKFRE